MATFLKDKQFAVEGTLLNLFFKTFFLIFKRNLHWTETEKVYILNLFKVPASCYSNWNLVFPWELCVSLKYDLFTFHTSYNTRSGDELSHFQNILLPPGTLQLWSSCHQSISTAVSPCCHHLWICRLLTLTGIKDSKIHKNDPSNILNSQYHGLFYSNDHVL